MRSSTWLAWLLGLTLTHSCPLLPVQVGAVADPATGERVEKAVFVAFFAGERARQKILKICEVGAGWCERLEARL